MMLDPDADLTNIGKGEGSSANVNVGEVK